MIQQRDSDVEFLFTQDPTCIIVSREENFLFYYQIETQESWVIYGCCNHKGTCIDGAVDPDLRPVEERLDIPVRPEISDKCTCDLKGEYL